MGNYFLDTQHIKTSRIKTVIEQEIEKNMDQLDLA